VRVRRLGKLTTLVSAGSARELNTIGNCGHVATICHRRIIRASFVVSYDYPCAAQGQVDLYLSCAQYLQRPFVNHWALLGSPARDPVWTFVCARVCEHVQHLWRDSSASIFRLSLERYLICVERLLFEFVISYLVLLSRNFDFCNYSHVEINDLINK
jgi:hypothetical protein